MPAQKTALSSTPLHYQVNTPRPMRTFVLNAGSAASSANTPAASELHNRIEGVAGDEANQ
jgi:hypothetical protein